MRRFPFALFLTLAGTVAGAATVTVSPSAQASVSIAVLFDDLVRGADAVVVATPVEQYSAWEDNRIFTYSRVHVDSGVAGEVATGADVWVRSMGGIVDHVGQNVDGEAVLSMGRSSMLFLRKSRPGAFDVVARAQGQYPIQQDENAKVRRLIRNQAVGVLFPPRAAQDTASASGLKPQSSGVIAGSNASRAAPLLAREALADKPLEEATRVVADAWKRLHGGK